MLPDSELTSGTSSPLSMSSEVSHLDSEPCLNLSDHHLGNSSGRIGSTVIHPSPSLCSALKFRSVHNFLHHGSQFGFFLHVQNFWEAAMGHRGHGLAAGLLDVVYLWAVHLSGSGEFAAHEPSYLSCALRMAADALSGTHYNTVLHAIQAEVLLSHYFLRNARFLEGKYVRPFYSLSDSHRH